MTNEKRKRGNPTGANGRTPATATVWLEGAQEVATTAILVYTDSQGNVQSVSGDRQLIERAYKAIKARQAKPKNKSKQEG